MHTPTRPGTVFDDALRELHEPLGGLTLLRWGVDPRAAWAVAHHHRRQPPAAPDRRSEVIFLAAHLDAALVAREEPDIDRWFAEGQLTAPHDRVVTAIARARGLGRVAPYFIDADAGTGRGAWPRGGLTEVRFRNHHLAYALTWFALAALVAGAPALLWRDGRRSGG